ncbi:glycosyltransferase [Pyxidicoccus fallax]|uniref:Glycosyltransferase n=1 Tax=Pyxidicoccus fallax TaxID=394095 RepID=A0A848LC14_9BACT|nr:glycosyltransferase [Pyxidicoccus fallax]NMO16600.1 glycosyltransferase [Pyxidicoccus fallax]NPC78381.1 glycosyltransferase [Pyxidicoccus fallax]
MPNRLLIFSPSAFQPSGHQQSYLTGLGEALSRLDVEVHVLGLRGSVTYPPPLVPHAVGGDAALASRSAYRERLGRLGDVAWGTHRLQRQANLLSELRRVHQHLGSPPLLFETFEYISLAAHLARARRRHRQVCIFHDTNFNLKHASPVAATYKLLARPFARHILRSVDRAFVHAPGMRENLVANVDPERRYMHKVEVLPYGAPHPDQVPRMKRAQARAALGLDTRRKVALAFGTLRADKCFRLVFEALARSPAWELLVAGPEGDVSYRQLEALREQTGLQERVRMVPGFIPVGEHARYFGAADAVLNLYDEHIRHESGTAQLARAFLRPVIAGGPPDLLDYVRETGAGWAVSPLTVDRLAEVLDDAARQDEAGRSDMERRIHAAAVARSWDAVASRVFRALGG